MPLSGYCIPLIFSDPQLSKATQSLIDILLASEAFSHYQQAHTRFNADSDARMLLDQLSKSQARVRQQQGKVA